MEAEIALIVNGASDSLSRKQGKTEECRILPVTLLVQFQVMTFLLKLHTQKL